MFTSRTTLGWTSLAALCVALAWQIDTRTYAWAVDFALRIERPQIHTLFVATGRLAAWILAAVALALIDWRGVGSVARDTWYRRAILMIGPVSLAAIISVVAKCVIRRERPFLNDGEMVFRAWSYKLTSSSALGMPSGETSVAFAGMFMLYRMYPAAWPVWFLLAFGCGACRVLTGEHFLSDVVAGAFLGCACAGVVWARARARGEVGQTGEPARRAILRGTAFTGFSAFLAFALAFVSSRHPWESAMEDDVPGIYTSRPIHGQTISYYFEPDGRYTMSAFIESEPPQLNNTSGTWRFDAGSLCIGTAQPASMEKSGRLLRLTTDKRSVVLYREERWNPESWIGPGPSNAPTQ